MKRYYNSDILDSHNLIPVEDIENRHSFYESDYIDELNCVVAILYVQNKITSITFYDIEFSEVVSSYVNKNFGNIKIITFHNLSELNKITKIYMEGKLSTVWTYQYYSANKLKLSILQDEMNNLIEYRQSIYDELGNHIEEKIFFADSWTIHTEKMI
ncbi:MAG TPA: hypothetical protein VIM65_15725 [Cyclobacteriaceae bacterium]